MDQSDRQGTLFPELTPSPSPSQPQTSLVRETHLTVRYDHPDYGFAQVLTFQSDEARDLTDFVTALGERGSLVAYQGTDLAAAREAARGYKSLQDVFRRLPEEGVEAIAGAVFHDLLLTMRRPRA